MFEEIAKILKEELQNQDEKKPNEKIDKKDDGYNLQNQTINKSLDDKTSEIFEKYEKEIFNQSTKDEIAFLSVIKERILVLFEGINSFEVTDVQARVELSLKFMEFLLASIDERLEKLSR